MEIDLLIRDGRVCTEDAPPARGSVGVRHGRIAVVAESAAGLHAKETIDADGRLGSDAAIMTALPHGVDGPTRAAP